MNKMNKGAADIFNTIAARDAAPARKSAKKVTVYSVMYNNRASRKLYTRKQANRIAARMRRLGTDAYVAVFGKITVAI